MKFSASSHISSTPKASFCVEVGHLDRDWKVYAKIEFLRDYFHVHRIWPSVGAVREHKIDALVQAAIAYVMGHAKEVERWEQASWGVAPDVVIYEVQEKAHE